MLGSMSPKTGIRCPPFQGLLEPGFGSVGLETPMTPPPPPACFLKEEKKKRQKEKIKTKTRLSERMYFPEDAPSNKAPSCLQASWDGPRPSLLWCISEVTHKTRSSPGSRAGTSVPCSRVSGVFQTLGRFSRLRNPLSPLLTPQNAGR